MTEMTLQEFVAGFTWPVIICLIIGIVLLILEMFTPGFGVAGVAGILFLIAAVLLKAKSFTDGLWMSVVVMVIVGVLLLIFFQSATKGALSRSPIVLKDALNNENGYISAEDLAFFVGKEGDTLTVLRPAGMADFDGVKLDVVSDGEFIPAGVRVRVMSVEGRRILVRQQGPEKRI